MNLATSQGRLRTILAVPSKSRTLKFDKIGYWSELKLEIIKKYADAYSKILTAQKENFHHVYIDAFAGAGEHRRKSTDEPIAGSPLRALTVTPPFREYFLIDLEEAKIDNLRSHIGDRRDVQLMQGDCNELLAKKVFPNVL